MSSKRSGRAIALVSGGLDSIVSLASAVIELDVRLVLFFNYGQRALASERRAVLGAVNYFSIPFREIELGWLRELSPPAMTSPAAGGDSAAHGSGYAGLGAVWIPNRNGVFINTAAAFAEKYDCEYVVTGFNAEEAVEFPDNRREYVARLNRCLLLSTMNRVKIVSFTQDFTKEQIISRGMDMSAPLSIVWSCYEDGAIMCGRCPSCTRLRNALRALPDSHRPVLEFGWNGAAGERGRDGP
jgi:7-cyano-7-deazaguanine synthase